MDLFKTTVWATALAIFSMFFGAGNVVFPLAVGQQAQNMNTFAVLGLLITAVGVPLLGLITMTLFDGDYKSFFNRIGVRPGFILSLIIMGLIGPFGAIPRCIALSYSTAKLFFPQIELNLPLFSIVSCLLIFVFTIKQNKIVDVLGYLLTPFLLGTLIIIIIKGILSSPPLPETVSDKLSVFLLGLKEGYQTMDLLGAFFFSSVVLVCLKQDMVSEEKLTPKKLIYIVVKASIIAAALLGFIYVGFSFVAAFQSFELSNVGQESLLAKVALLVLGPYAGVVACAAVALACITTAIALSAVSADFIHIELTNGRLPYSFSLFLTLVITFLMSTLDFKGIITLLTPILQICYPALIVLTILNLAYKLWDFQPIKVPFFTALAISFIAYFF